MSMGSCVGNVEYHISNFFNPTSSAWNDMSDTLKTDFISAHAEAVLLGYIGKSVDMVYGNTGSGSNMDKLHHFFADTIGFSCNRQLYSVDTVKKYIRQCIPIVIGAYTDTNLGHCFVIDGYKRTRIKFTHYIYFKPDDPDSNIWYPPISYDVYSNPTLSYICINWGWKDQWTNGINDGWFGLTDNWILDDGLSFVPWASMLFGFHL